jgi:hypothetical protein
MSSPKPECLERNSPAELVVRFGYGGEGRHLTFPNVLELTSLPGHQMRRRSSICGSSRSRFRAHLPDHPTCGQISREYCGRLSRSAGVFDASKPAGLAQKPPLTEEYQKVFVSAPGRRGPPTSDGSRAVEAWAPEEPRANNHRSALSVKRGARTPKAPIRATDPPHVVDIARGQAQGWSWAMPMPGLRRRRRPPSLWLCAEDADGTRWPETRLLQAGPEVPTTQSTMCASRR